MSSSQHILITACTCHSASPSRRILVPVSRNSASSSQPASAQGVTVGLSQPWAIQADLEPRAMTVDGGAEIPGRPQRRADRPRARSRNPHALRPAPLPRQSEAGQSEGTRGRVCVRVSACTCTRGPRLTAPRTPPASRSPAAHTRPHLGCRAGAGARPTAAGSAPTSSPRWRPRAPAGWGSGRPRSPASPSQVTGAGRREEGSGRSAEQASCGGRGLESEELHGSWRANRAGSVGTAGDRGTDGHGDTQNPKAAFPGCRSPWGQY